MFRDFSWYLRECALKDYAIWEESCGDKSTRAYERCMRFLALADVLHPTQSPYDLEYEYRRQKGDFDFDVDY